MASKTCICRTPQRGRYGWNAYTCSDGSRGFCRSEEFCFATAPFAKGEWSSACSESLGATSGDGKKYRALPSDAASVDAKVIRRRESLQSVERCLRDGAWRAGRDADHAGAAWASAWHARASNSSSKFFCKHLSWFNQTHLTWHGHAPHCKALLLPPSPLDARLDDHAHAAAGGAATAAVAGGAQSERSSQHSLGDGRPLTVFVLGDSIGRQLDSTLRLVADSR